MVGSLSLLAHQPLPGYEPLPDFPEEQPDTRVRDVEELEGWSGSRTTVMESGFGSDSFSNRGRASTALSGIEAMGSSSVYPNVVKKKGNDYDLDAFYDESSEDKESSEEISSEEEEDDEESEEGSEEESEEEETDSDGSSASEDVQQKKRH